MSNNKEKCSLVYCDKESLVKGLCNGHYQQQWHGKEFTPLRTFVTHEEIMKAGGRVCSFCEEFKSLENFYIRKDGKTQTRCRRCYIALQQIRQWNMGKRPYPPHYVEYISSLGKDVEVR